MIDDFNEDNKRPLDQSFPEGPGYTLPQEPVIEPNQEKNFSPKFYEPSPIYNLEDLVNTFLGQPMSFERLTSIDYKSYKPKNIKSKSSFDDYRLDQVFENIDHNHFKVHIDLKNLVITTGSLENNDTKKLEIKDLKVFRKTNQILTTSFIWKNINLEGDLKLPESIVNRKFLLNNYQIKNLVLILDYKIV